MKAVIILMMFFASSVFAAPVTKTVEKSSSTISESDGEEILISKKKRRRKKRRKRKKKSQEEPKESSSEESEATLKTGKSVHPVHEGEDAPYSKMLNVSFLYNSTSSTIETEAGSSDPVDSSSMGLNLIYYMRFGSIFAGPAISYSSNSWGEDSTMSSTAFGGGLRYHLGDIDNDPGLMFVGANLLMGSDSSSSNGTDSSTSSTVMTLAGGYMMFLDSNVALDMSLSYDLMNQDKADESTTNNSVLKIAAALSVFL